MKIVRIIIIQMPHSKILSSYSKALQVIKVSTDILKSWKTVIYAFICFTLNVVQ